MWIRKAEWERLIADHAAAVASVRRWDAERIALLDSITRLNERLGEERIRAEHAIDQLLAQRGGVPITPSRVPDPNAYPGVFDEDPDVLRLLREDMKQHGIVDVLQRHGDGG